MTQIPGSKRAQKELTDHRKNKEDQKKRDLRFVMRIPEGRRFIFDLLDQRCLLFSASYTGNSETYLREGRRAVGIELTKELQAECRNEYVQMIVEAFQLKNRDDLIEQVAEKVAEGDE